MILFDHNFSLDARVGRENVSSGISTENIGININVDLAITNSNQIELNLIGAKVNPAPSKKAVEVASRKNRKKSKKQDGTQFGFGCWDYNELD